MPVCARCNRVAFMLSSLNPPSLAAVKRVYSLAGGYGCTPSPGTPHTSPLLLARGCVAALLDAVRAQAPPS
ncbi:hypothetical protein EON67_09070 [archaeon]|nr:MAG: hypothetical protein EON67_09070 [archaeon]